MCAQRVIENYGKAEEKRRKLEDLIKGRVASGEGFERRGEPNSSLHLTANQDES